MVHFMVKGDALSDSRPKADATSFVSPDDVQSGEDGGNAV